MSNKMTYNYDFLRSTKGTVVCLYASRMHTVRMFDYGLFYVRLAL